MTHKTGEVTQEIVREVLAYNSETGVFSWRVSRGRVKPGSAAGTAHGNGYIQIRIGRRPYYAHRLAWLYVYGMWPDEEIDHINRVKADNRISNLRCVTRSQNAHNMPRLKTNTSGFPGVSWCKRACKWRAAIALNGKQVHLGLHDTAEQASAAYTSAAPSL